MQLHQDAASRPAKKAHPSGAETSGSTDKPPAAPWRGAVAVLDKVGHGVLVLDEQHRVVLVNRPARNFLQLGQTTAGIPLRTLLSQSPVLDNEAATALAARCVAAELVEEDLTLSIAGGGKAHAHVRALANRHRAVFLEPAVGRTLMRGDRLTGLACRDGFVDAIDAAVAAHEQPGHSAREVAVVAVDLGRAGWVTDPLGNPLGDALLRSVAQRLRSALRRDDVAARISGDEFAILAELGDGRQDAAELSERLVDVVGATHVLDGHAVHVDVRAGVAIAPEHGEEAEMLMRRAKLALRQARQDARRVVLFDPAMQSRAEARRLLEMDLRRAMELNQFELHYQPLVSIACGGLSGFEALIRWRHPKRGLVAPADFIPLAEEIGLIADLGAWVVREACREAASWTLPVSVSVNASSAQFESGHLVSVIARALDAAGLPGNRLHVEITESALLRRSDSTLQALHALRAMGIQIAMDDFGTGYSSLLQLQSFPFDKLKIDRSFVSRLTSAPDSSAIVRAIARMGDSLGLRTVAEGVETAEQMDVVRAEGCHEVQGYLLSRPVPTAEIGRILNRFGAATVL